MADSTVAGLTSSIALVGTELFYADNGSADVKVTANQIKTFTGGGNVVGPASATDNAVVRFDATTGKLIQNSAAIIDDNGNLIVNAHTSFGNSAAIATQYVNKLVETFSNAALQATFGGGLNVTIDAHLTSGSSVGLIGSSFFPSLEVDTGLTATALQCFTMSGVASGAGSFTKVQGLIVESSHQANGNVGSYLAGGEFSVQHTGTGTCPLLMGVSVSSFQSATAGLITDVFGVTARHTLLNDATNVYTLYAGAPGTGGSTNITNNFGLYIEDQSGKGSTISDNIRSKGAASFNVFEGVLRLGTATNASPQNGDIWYDGTNIKKRVGGVTSNIET